jgi:DNA invertase Pin-like site-specific DNA recombinase
MPDAVQGRGHIRRNDKAPCAAPLFEEVRSGDTLTVWKLDRLGRSLPGLITHARRPETPGLKLRSLTEAIDAEPPTGRAMWQMIGVLAELERRLICERTRAGVKAARGRGVKFGRKPKLTPQQINHARKMIDAGKRREDVAGLLNVDRTALYHALAAFSVS